MQSRVPSISVIICTYNPRQDYLSRTLDALEKQTFSKSEWELIIIDNASDDSVEDRLSITWHPSYRIAIEETPGLTAARKLGIQIARGELLVFVDDDNVLEQNYLSESWRLAREYPFLGAFGGSQIPEFEIEPAKEVLPFTPMLALREVSEVRWTNNPHPDGSQRVFSVPWGAGLVVRQSVAKNYLDVLKENILSRGIDRSGALLLGHGDVELVLCSCHLGLGYALFPGLRLKHLISSDRVTPKYLLALRAGGAASAIIFDFLRSGVEPQPPSYARMLLHLGRQLIANGWFSARMQKAAHTGALEGHRLLGKELRGSESIDQDS